MNILYLDWPCFGREYMIHALEEAGHNVVYFFHPDYQQRSNKSFEEAFVQCIENRNIDCCFSFNYFHMLACCCYHSQIKYISMVYDSPQLMLYCYSLIYPTNYVFLFDKQEYLSFKNAGISTVYYSPLPAESDTVITLREQCKNTAYYSSDVSFVGSLYHEDHDLFGRFKNLSSYTEGYLDAIMQAQLKVSGYNFIEDVLTSKVLADLQASVPYNASPGGTESASYVYANYFINRRLTAIERHHQLSLVAEHAPLKVFTRDLTIQIPNAKICGTVDYYKEMPLVFANSKINLNISLRSIKSGIPLRAMDIMASGGFLLTNYQADFLDYFVPNEDFVYYESDEDLIEKMNYFLTHDNKRAEIAYNGYQKVKKNHNYQCFLQRIFSIVFPT